MNLWGWLRRHDPGFAALRRAGRTAIVMPAIFALGDKVIENPAVATFGAFGSFAMLLLVDFSGAMRERLQAQAALSVVGAGFVAVGTLASRESWLAAAAMAAVGFGVLFVGVVSSVLASATTSLLLAFILPVTAPGAISTIPDRLAGWGLASVASWLAVALLWPAPARDPLRAPTIAACRALGARLRSDVAFLLGEIDGATGGQGAPRALEHDEAMATANAAVMALHKVFLATPYRPTGLSTGARTLVRLVDELNWLNSIVVQSVHPIGIPPNRPACAVKLAAAAVLECGADVLDRPGQSSQLLSQARLELNQALDAVERNATSQLPVRTLAVNATRTDGTDSISPTDDEPIAEFITSLDPTFRAQELSFVVSQVGANINLAAAAERRNWIDRLLGRQPTGLASAISAAEERAAAHVERHSVWLHNSLRGAAGLALAVFIANGTGVQHSFWVVLGTLSVLRSNALNTGSNIVRGLLGTVVGFIAGAGILALIGTDTTVLWVLLPVAILLAGIAPAAISFAAGQAAFTLTIVILFNIIQPAGWRVGLIRVEDVALGCAVSLVVGLLFWPRGAATALSHALADAYTDSAHYLSSAVAFGMQRCDRNNRASSATDTANESSRNSVSYSADDSFVTTDAIRAAAAARRLDDTYRNYLAERGSKRVALADVTGLVTGVVGLRLAADAVLDLWQREDGATSGDRTAARQEILSTSSLVSNWYDHLAASLTGGGDVPEPLAHDKSADGRLVSAVRHDLQDADGQASATAVRMIWTGDHLDAARRLQTVIVAPATAAAEQRALTRITSIRRPNLRAG